MTDVYSLIRKCFLYPLEQLKLMINDTTASNTIEHLTYSALVVGVKKPTSLEYHLIFLK